MCGIFGSVFEPSVDPVRERMQPVLAALRHRGPDDSAHHAIGAAQFAFARLAILDLSPNGRQPMVSEGDRHMLVFNGEIYNYRELREELVSRGHRFVSEGDSEVVLRGLMEHGPRWIERLSGMFALGFFDVERQQLLLARDRSGKKPLYWTRAGDGLRFASEPKALFAAGTPRRPRLASLGTLLQLGYPLAPDTPYEAIFELPPGHLLHFERDREPRLERYTPPPLLAPRTPWDENEALATIERSFEAAVERRLVSDVPLGCYLSGGIDSSLVAAAAARHTSGKLQTFSVGFDGDAAYDETVHARQVAGALGTEHHELRLNPVELERSFLELVSRLTWAHDGPFADSSAIPTSLLAEYTRQHVTVALSGDGGDELFCGYERLLAAELSARIPQPIGALGQRLLAKVGTGGRERSLRARALRFSSQLGQSEAMRLLGYSPLRPTPELLRPELRDRVDWHVPLQRTQAVLDEAASQPPLGRLLHHNFSMYLAGDLLIKADRSSMLHSLEVRSPFLDNELMAHAARLPPRLLRRGLSTKWLLRRVGRDWNIPKSIFQRRKMGFGVPLGTWFRGSLRPALEQALAKDAKVHEWLAPGATARLLREHQSGSHDHAAMLFLLLTLAIWVQTP